MPPRDASARPVKLGWEEFLELPEDGNRYEILDGELAMTPPPAIRHQRVSRNLELVLHQFVTTHRLGEILHAPVAVRLADDSIVEPDIIFIATEQDALVGPLSIDGAPSLVVEILSPSTAARDRSIKAQLYARRGVAHYWIVDPEARTMEAFVLEGAAYRNLETVEGGATFAPALFAGLEIDLAGIWA